MGSRSDSSIIHKTIVHNAAESSAAFKFGSRIEHNRAGVQSGKARAPAKVSPVVREKGAIEGATVPTTSPITRRISIQHTIIQNAGVSPAPLVRVIAGNSAIV